MKDTLPIQEIMQTIKKRMGLILFLVIGLIGLAAVISYFFLTPVYQSSSQFIVIQQQNENVQIGMNEIETNLGLINTYNEIIESPLILEQVIDKMNLSITPEELAKQIEVTSGENSQVVTVTSIGASPDIAAEIANQVVEEFKNTIMSIMRIENVFVLSDANPLLSQEPIRPRPIINMFVAGVIGLATGIGLALVLEFLNTKIKTENDVETLGITVLGTISFISNNQVAKGSNKKPPTGKEIEGFET